jgi:glutaconate CoA-transferase subunit B
VSATPAGAPGFSAAEMMIVAAARELAGKRVCFVGVGLPNIAVNLARRTVAPQLELVYEAGVFGAQPARLPLSIGDPTIVTRATAVTSMFELFGFYLQGGLIDVGFLGAAQIDRHANINTTVIGEYATPRTRLPGSGGACEIAQNAQQVFVIMRQSPRSFVEQLDFRTSVGARVAVVVTDKGIYHMADGEMRLDSLHPGLTLDELRASMAWAPRVAADLRQTPPPTDAELRLIREELDPGGTYTK